MNYDEIRRDVREMLEERTTMTEAVTTCSRCFGKGCARCHGRGSISSLRRDCGDGCLWCRAMREEMAPRLELPSEVVEVIDRGTMGAARQQENP